MLGILLGFAMGLFGGGMLPQPIQRSLSYQVNKYMPNNLPDVFTLSYNYFHGFIDDKEYYDVMKMLGYDGKTANYIINTFKKFYTIEQIFNMYRKGFLSKENAKKYLMHNGYSESEAEHLLLSDVNYLNISEYAEAYRRGLIDEKEFKDYLKKYAIEDKSIELIISLTKSLFSVNNLVEMKIRGIISENEYLNEMEKLGYEKDKAKKILELGYRYPSVEDFIRFAVRDVFNPERVKKYKLDIEFPEHIIQYAEKSGIKPEWLKWYWMAHWQLPSPEMVIRMVNILQPKVINTILPDGTRYGDKYKAFGINPDDIITDYDDLSEYLAMADISPYWRDRIKALTFPPLTRVDLRRIYELGLISDEELLARLLELGYSEYDAKKLIEFYKAYKNRHEKDLTKSEILKLYSIKAIDKDEAIKLLKNLGYDDIEAEYIIKLQEYKDYAEAKDEYVKILIEQYSQGIISEQELNYELNRLNLPSSEIIFWMEKAYREKMRKSKIPSHKELIQMYEKGIINDNEFSEYMRRIGFSDYWIEKYKNMIKGGG